MSYTRALAIDPQYAPALRNLGVLRDMYQDDPAGALRALRTVQDADRRGAAGDQLDRRCEAARRQARARSPAPQRRRRRPDEKRSHELPCCCRWRAGAGDGSTLPGSRGIRLRRQHRTAAGCKGRAAAQPQADHRNGRSRCDGDRVELDTTQITGNRELPRVLYVVPWKRADLGELSGKPAKQPAGRGAGAGGP